MCMMQLVGGYERTLEQMDDLLKESGFQTNIDPIPLFGVNI